MIAKKTCPACGKRLPAADFNGSAKTAGGLARTCRACINARRRERYRSGVKHPQGHARSTVIAAALRRGDIKVMKKLLDAGMTPQWNWICETMREGHIALAELLLQSGVERNIFTMSAMGDVKGLTTRLKRVRADAGLTTSMEPASRRVTPLHVACASDWKSHGHGRMAVQAQVAMTLAERGADLNARARYRGIGDVAKTTRPDWKRIQRRSFCNDRRVPNAVDELRPDPRVDRREVPWAQMNSHSRIFRGLVQQGFYPSCS